ncbi:MAG: FAD-dependent oxidoreductase [bacterium]|nr:FAD-dependent oxidoreductase [bacterium]
MNQRRRSRLRAIACHSLAAGVIATSAIASPQASSEHDLVVYGATSAGVIAAIQARSMGRSVIVVGPDLHLGGLTASGLGWTDSGDKEVVGGLSRSFYQRLKQHYDQPRAWRQQKASEYRRYRPADDAMWVFEPHVAERVLEEWIASLDVPVERDSWLDRAGGVKIEHGRIESIRMLDGTVYRGRMFIDATYEGDLLDAAGVSFQVGREANERYGETLNGVQTRRAVSHQFEHKIDPYVVPGDPTSGLLPRIHAGVPGVENSGDHRVQAYTYRLCMTDAPGNRVPFVKPDGYDAAQYELLLRTLLAGSTHVFGKLDPAPNRKTDTNNHGSFSTDNIGMNYDYPTASYERRREILEEHELYQRGYFYFLCNDRRVPEEVRSRMGRWGLAKDEFVENDHWPHQIYVREARRMVSDFVMTEHHLRGLEPTPRPVGMGSYNMDSHNVQRYVAHDEDGTAFVRNEGDIQVHPGGPYPVSFDALVPKREECVNLLVPVCLSSSHIAYGSIRMEPVFMVLGQSAATAACLAIDQECFVQDVDYEQLRARLLADGQVLEGAAENRNKSTARTSLTGLVMDDAEAELEGNWEVSSSQPSFLEQGYRHDQNELKGEKSARFVVRIPDAGRYSVRLAYAPHPNRASRVPVTIEHAKGSTTVHVDQRRRPTIDGLFVPLGSYDFTRGPARVTIETAGTAGYVVVDGIQLVRE